MGFKGVEVNKSNGNLGRHNSTNDGTCLLIIGGATAASGLTLKYAKEYLSLANAEADGITVSYDDTNNILANHHIDEFFRISPNGNLFIVLDDGTMTDIELKAILKTNQNIKSLGFVRNGDAPADFSAYVGAKQNIVNVLKEESRKIDAVIVEGIVFDGATAISDYLDLRTLNAPNVSVVIGQDPIIRNVKPAHEKYAAVGSVLGAISIRSVNENIGSVDIETKPNSKKAEKDYPLTDKGRSRWISAVLQNGIDFNILEANEIKELNKRGYVYVGSYNGYAGYYFNDSHTCVEKGSDYSRIENNRVWNKAAGLLRQALLPRVKSNLLKDPDTGSIREIEATELETLGNNAIRRMTAASEISGSEVYIDPTQDLTNDVPLIVKAQVVFNNIIHEFSVDLGLTNKI